MKIICSILMLLTSIAASAQELQLSSAVHQPSEKVTIYREWPTRRLIDTPLLVQGHLQYQLPDSGAAVYSIRLRKPFADATIFSSAQPVTITIGKDSLVVVKGDVVQQKMDDFEHSMKPAEAAWSALGTRYGQTNDLDEKLAISAEINRMAGEVQAQRLRFALNNAGNLAGAWSAYHYAFAWTPASLSKLVPAYGQQPWAQATLTVLRNKQSEAASLSMTGQPAPLFTLRTINNQMLRLDSLIKQNKYVLLDVWASWCTPCRAGNRKLAAHYAALRKKGIEIVSVSVDEKEDLWKKAVAADKIPWPQLVTPNGMKSEIVQQYKVKSLPATFLINNKGEIVQQHIEITDLEKLK